MAETIHYRFTVRGGTAAALEERNEIPLARELVVATDTGLIKLGDGATNYNDLPLIGGVTTAPVELRTTVTHIQWREVGAPTWKDLVEMEELEGPRGGDGPPAIHIGYDPPGRLDLAWLDTTEAALKYHDGTGWVVFAIGTEGPPGPPGEGSYATMGAAFSIQSSSAGAQAMVRVNCDANITAATLLAAPSQSGSAVVDVLKCAFAEYPNGLISICAGAKPTLSNAASAEDVDLVGWDAEIKRGDCVVFVLESAAGLSDLVVVLDVIKTNPE